MRYAEKYGVSRASRKYNRSRSCICFWKARYDGTPDSLACRSKRPHSHPRQHTDAEIKLFRVLRRLDMLPPARPQNPYRPKPYQQMTHPGERIQIDVKIVPRRCIADPELRLFQYTAIDEFSRMRFLGAYEEQSTYSSADFLRRAVAWFKRNGVAVECVQTDNGTEFTNRFTAKKELPSLFEETAQNGHPPQADSTLHPKATGKVERSHREDQKR